MYLIEVNCILKNGKDEKNGKNGKFFYMYSKNNIAHHCLIYIYPASNFGY